MRQQRRQRREEHRVDEDDRADEEEQPLSGAIQRGLRLSRNARSPSCPSSPERRPAAIRASSSPSDGRSRASRFAARVASGPDCRISPTTRSTAASRSSATSWTRPIRSAVSASKRSPVRKKRRAAPVADLREHERRDDRGDDPEPHLGEAERRVGRRDDDVRAGDEPGAAAEREALHARDERRRARVDRLHHPVEPQRILDVLLEAEVDRGALPLDVGARAEARPVAGEHDDARVADVRERLVQLARSARRRRRSAARASRA